MNKITLNGVDYPATFSLRVALHAAEKYGSIGNIFDGGESEVENLQKWVWFAHELMTAGKIYAEKENGETTNEVPSVDTIFDLLNYNDLAQLKMQLVAVALEDQKAKIEVVPSKNAETTQGQ